MKEFIKNSIALLTGLVLVLQVVLFSGSNSCIDMKQESVATEMSSHCSMPMDENASCCSSEQSKTTTTSESCQIACDCELKATFNDKVLISSPFNHEFESPVFSTVFEIQTISAQIVKQQFEIQPPGLLSNPPIYLTTETFRI